MPERSKNQRRSPQQARARATCEAILEAASQILERRGPAGLNTNDVAERAGVSIGTLYQYFPDKQAILAAAARRELGETLAGRQRALVLALIEMVERLGRFGAAATPAAGRAPSATRRARQPDGLRRVLGAAEEILRWLTPSPTPAPIPIRLRR